MKRSKLLGVLLGILIAVPAAADPHFTPCLPCCNATADSLRYTHHSMNKMFRDLGTIKLHVWNRSSPWTGRRIGGTRTTTVRACGGNAARSGNQCVTVTVDPEFNYTGIPNIPFLRLPTSVKVHHVRTPHLVSARYFDLRPIDISRQLHEQGGWATSPNQLPYVAGCAKNACYDDSCHENAEAERYISINFPWGDGRMCSNGSVKDRVLCALRNGFVCDCGENRHGRFNCVKENRVELPIP